jgi:type IV secretion system protein VirB10
MKDLENDLPHPEKPIKPNPDDEAKISSLENDLPGVAKPQKDYRKWVVMGVIGLLGIGLVLKTFKHTETTAVIEDKTATTEMPEYHNMSKPEAARPFVPKPVKVAEPSENPDLVREKLKRLKEQEDAYRARQNAPTSFYKSSTAKSPIGSNTNAVRLSQSAAASGQLPLSAEQISALKKAQQSTNDPNEAFANSVSDKSVERVEAASIPYRDDTVTQGTLISGVLQTAINSDLPGMVKANVSQDIYGNSGEKLLIPKGSTLVGQYSAGISMGQERVFVMWTRLIRPDGVSVMLGSPGTDQLGTAGMGADILQTHFWERFGGATLVSIVGGTIATAGVSESEGYNSASNYRMMMSDNFQQSANATLLSTLNRKPTIIIHQGDKINVFVNRDLSFHNVEGSSNA